MSYCTACFSDAINYGEIYPDHYLLLDKENYKIVSDHDEIIRFSEKPVGDPWRDYTHDQELHATKEDTEKFMAFSKRVEDFRINHFKFHPQHGHKMVELCKQVGYEPDVVGWLDYWLYDRAAAMIEKGGKLAVDNI